MTTSAVLVRVGGADCAQAARDHHAFRPPFPPQATRHAELEAFDALRAADEAAGRPPRASLAGVTLVVTVEPCIMCGAALADTLKPDAVVFGCWNDRFGGCGSVLDAVGDRHGGCGLEEGDAGQAAGAPPFELRGGVRAAEAVALLKQFYETGNPTGKGEMGGGGDVRGDCEGARGRVEEGGRGRVEEGGRPRTDAPSFSSTFPQPPTRAAPSCRCPTSTTRPLRFV